MTTPAVEEDDGGEGKVELRSSGLLRFEELLSGGYGGGVREGGRPDGGRRRRLRRGLDRSVSGGQDRRAEGSRPDGVG